MEPLYELIDYFGKERRYEVPDSVQGARDLLRSLMNVRRAGPVDKGVLALQDEYLGDRLKERGVTDSSGLTTAAEEFGSKVPESDRMALWQGDITLLRIGAVVNAANSGMTGCYVPMHKCIDNCIHTYAGVQLRNECARVMADYRDSGRGFEWPTAVPMVTDAYNLPADKVVHVVGPIVDGRLTEQNRTDLVQCYSRTLDACVENGIRSVAFCCISTGVFMFPNGEAAKIAVNTVSRWLSAHPGVMDLVVFNVFKDEDLEIYRGLLS